MGPLSKHIPRAHAREKKSYIKKGKPHSFVGQKERGKEGRALEGDPTDPDRKMPFLHENGGGQETVSPNPPGGGKVLTTSGKRMTGELTQIRGPQKMKIKKMGLSIWKKGGGDNL